MRYCSIILILLLISINIYGFVDRSEESRERLIRKLDELKSVKGVLVTGRGKVFFNSVIGDGTAFPTNNRQKRDIFHIMQMDLNFMARPAKSLEVGTTLRIESDIARFYDWGEARPEKIFAQEMYMEIILFKFLLLRFGSLYDKFTPFTLCAPVDAIPLRSELFFRHYTENLYSYLLNPDKTFPMKGLSLQSDFIIEDLGEIAFTAMLQKLADNADDDNSFDRYLVVGNSKVDLYKQLIINLVGITIQDLSDTGAPVYNDPQLNNILSGELQYDIAPALFSAKSPVKGLGVEGEIALSIFSPNKSNPSVEHVEGHANRISAFMDYENKIKVRTGWRGIDYEFVSPFAQTRMLTPGQNPMAFKAHNLPGFFTDYHYRSTVNLIRDNNDMLNHTYPMNTATPNRKGIFADFTANFGIVNAAADISSMKEVRPIGWGNDNLRSFLRYTAEFSFDMSVAFKSKGLPKISVFYINEDNKRNDDPDTDITVNSNLNEKENRNINVVGFDIVLKPYEKFFFTALYQIYNVSGKKKIDSYVKHQPFLIAGYSPVYDVDIENTVFGAGIIYEFTKVVGFQVDFLKKQYTGQYSLDEYRGLALIRF